VPEITDPAILAQLNGAPAAPAATGEVTDPELLRQLNAPAAPAPTLTQQLTDPAGWKRAAALTARNLYSGAAALPLSVMDLGVMGRNVLGNAYNRVVGNPATPDYTLPSTLFQQNLSALGAPVPQTPLEKAGSFLEQNLAGAMVPTGPLTVANQAPANFVSAPTAAQQLKSALLARAQGKGLVVPPSTTNPTWLNRALESIAGKENVQNYARLMNDEGRTAIARQSLVESGATGIGENAPFTPDAVKAVMKEAGQSMDAAKSVPKFSTDGQYVDDMAKVLEEHANVNESFPGAVRPEVEDVVNTYLQDSMTGKSGVAATRLLREQAGDAFRRGDSELGRVYKGVSNAIENQIDRAVQNPDLGVSPDAVAIWRRGRVLYAKGALIRDSMLPDGTVSGPKLAAAWRNDEPITGDLRTAAEFAAQYPKANLSASASGSPVSHLAGGLGPAISGAATEMLADRYKKEGEGGSFLPFIAGAVAYPLARTSARSYLLGPGQAGAIPPPPSLPPNITPSQVAALAYSLKGQPPATGAPR